MTRVLVTGASGYVGSALVPRLEAAGYEVRGFGRSAVRAAAGLEFVEGDAVTGAGLDEALDGVEAAYFLIHSMEASTDGTFADRERRSVEHFVAAAQRAGVRRAIYLGGPVPTGAGASPHLASRLLVEEMLLRELPDSVAFRASIIVGARSRSFRFLVRLVERLPVLAIPAWRRNRTRPIDGRDVLEYLVRAANEPEASGRSLDVVGPDVLTYEEIIDRIREHMLVGRATLRLGFSLTPVASRVAAAVASEDPALIHPLMQGLETDLLPRDEEAQRIFGVRLHSFDSAVERALREWERIEPLRAR